MKKVALLTLVATSSLILVWCGHKAKEQKSADPVEMLDNPTVTSGDVSDFNTLIGWSRYQESEKTTMFTFRGDNTFSVSSNGKEARGPWIVSEGEILLGEDQLELKILDNDTITIQWARYKRAQNDV